MPPLWVASDSAPVKVSFANLKPAANAGTDQAITKIGALVSLDGSKSTDPNGDLIKYE
jgi:hypothetical protein